MKTKRLKYTRLKHVTAEMAREVKVERAKVKELKDGLRAIRARIQREAVNVWESLHNDIKAILAGVNIEDRLTKLYYEQTLKFHEKSPKSRRWHPMIIRY